MLPHTALAKACSPACGVAQTCDETKGICTPPVSPSTNPTDVTKDTSPASSNGTGLVNPLKNITDLPTLLKAILGALVDIGTVVLILAFIWIGFMFVRAQGKPEELKKARSAFVWTIIGGLILLGAQAISMVIQSTVSNL